MSKSNIIRWRKQENDLKTSIGNNNGKASNVGWKNSRVTEPEMELILDGWIQNERLDGHRVTGDAIRKLEN